jgi:MFS family permease
MTLAEYRPMREAAPAHVSPKLQADDASAADRGERPHLFRALRHRNYRLYFAGQIISLVGSWLTRVATGWLVFRLTGSAWMLGVVGFAGLIPTFVLAPFAGVFVDRWNRHRVLVVTQVMLLLQAGALAMLSLTGHITVAHVIVLNVVHGLINALDMPARQALLVELVEDRNDLPNAIALNSSMVNAARLLGPAAAGFLIAWTGEGICFLIDALSYIAVVAALLAMRLAPQPARTNARGAWVEFREGFAYAFGFPPIRAILILLACVSLLSMSYTVLLPVFASRLPGGGPKLLGLLSAASGVGALAGALQLASRRTVVGLGRVVPLAGMLLGAGMIAFAFSRFLPLSLLAMTVMGYALISHFAAGNTILQTITDDEKRGRVMSFFSMAFMGMAPFGSLLTGYLADRINPSITVAVTGGACIGVSALFLLKLPELRALVRPIYVRKGILPQVASGLQSATETTSNPQT